MTWTNIWVYGYRAALEAWIEAKKVDDEYGGRSLPHEIFVVGPCYPQEQDGVDADGNPIYKRKTGAVRCIWCFSLYGDAATLVDEIKVLNGPYTIIEGQGHAYMLQNYPEHCLGQGIPHIAQLIEG